MPSSSPSYHKLDSSEQKSRKKALIIAVSSVVLLVAVFSVVSKLHTNHADGGHRVDQTGWKTTSKLVNPACRNTRYPGLCMSSVASYPGASTATPHDFANIALQVSLESAQNAHALALSLSNNMMNARERAAWRDCLELFEDTMDRLNVCLSHTSTFSSASDRRKFNSRDVQTWLSAALTNQETCLNGFHDFNITSTNENITVQALMSSRASNVSALLSNSLAMWKTSTAPTSEAGGEFHNRRLLFSNRDDYHAQEFGFGGIEDDGFPDWLSGGDRRLLQSTSSPASQANVVVSKDGTGNYKTITEAVNAAPINGKSRHVIYVKRGVYAENVLISNKMTNLMFIGDGKDATVVTGSRNVQDGYTTFDSATFAVSGNGFIAKDMTFQNTAGPGKNQAVALRVGGDLSVVYRCSFKGYQDTLYVYSLRQFYREVDVYGTADFIFGNAAVVFQNSNIFVRRPLSQQQNTITAQGRSDPNQNTGISIQNCIVTAASDLQPVVGSVKTYLGRPWRQYSRTVFMQSSLGGLIDPSGWVEWDGSFALSTLYYGEYMNTGAGAATAKRVRWPGFRVITSSAEASKFTVEEFISGNSWIQATEVPFTSGLN